MLNDGDGENLNNEDVKHPQNSNVSHKNGHGSTEYPKKFESPQRLKIISSNQDRGIPIYHLPRRP